MADLSDDESAKKELLEKARRIAVVGASPKRDRDANLIFRLLVEWGYDVLPVNPMVDEVEGVATVPDLAAAKEHWGDERIDIVDVFRNRDATPPIAAEAAEVGAGALWLQLGTDHPDAVATALDAGMDVVADRCIKVEHQRLIG